MMPLLQATLKHIYQRNVNFMWIVTVSTDTMHATQKYGTSTQ